MSTTHRPRGTAAVARRAASLARHPGRIAPGLRRRFGPPRTRAGRLALIMSQVDLDGLGLEIGPSHNPLLPKGAGYNVRIADHLDQDGLKAKYEGDHPTSRIEEVDYVLSEGRLTDTIADRFDYIAASHVIEHTVCLVSFLQDCEALLRPGGVLTLAVPDHRYCFDHFRERTALGRVVDVYRADPKVHSEGSVLEHQLNVVRRDGRVAWSKGAQGAFTYMAKPEDALRRSEVAASGTYVDTHNWVFTPHHFRLLLLDLHMLGFVGLREKSFHDTIDHEFFVTLAADADGPPMDREQLLALSAREAGLTGPVAFTAAPGRTAPARRR